jgi:hypothetical protein
MKKVNKLYCLYLLLSGYKLDTTIKDLLSIKDFIFKDKECVLSPETGQVFLSKHHRLHRITINYTTISLVLFIALLIHYFLFITYLINL